MRSLSLFTIVAFVALCVLHEPARSAWTANGVAATNAVRDQINPVLVPDGSGGLFCTWADFRSGLTNSAGTPVSDVYAQRIASNGTVLWTTDGVLVCADTLQQALPRLCSDGANGVIIAWQDFRSANTTTSLDVYAQRLDPNGNPLWGAGGTLVYGGPTAQAGPRLLSDGAGGAFIVWQDDRNGGAQPTDLYAQRLDASGAKLWGPGGIALCTAASTQSGANLIADGAGGFISTWQDARGTGGIGYYDVYAQRVSNAGSALWTANGVAVSTAVFNQVEPYLVTDGTGGAIITWQDGRISSANQDVYAQRLNSAGTPLWTTDGVALCDLPSQLTNLRIAEDGSAGAVMAWLDERTGFGVYAQRVDGSGVPQWADDGIPVTASTSCALPRICAATGGGVIVGWSEDHATTSYDVYAQKLNLAGNAQWLAGGVVVCAATLQQFMGMMSPDDVGGSLMVFEDRRNGATNRDVYALRLGPEGSPPTGVGRTPAVSALRVLPAVPNPSSSASLLSVELEATSKVHVDVFDVAGRRVAHREAGVFTAGWHEIRFDGRDNASRLLPNGVYFMRVSTGHAHQTQKLTIQR